MSWFDWESEATSLRHPVSFYSHAFPNRDDGSSLRQQQAHQDKEEGMLPRWEDAEKMLSVHCCAWEIDEVAHQEAIKSPVAQ